MKRRQFLIGCGAGAALVASSRWRLMASPLLSSWQSNNDHTFVLVFLRGGCDGLQLLAPVSERYYHDARPSSLKVNEKRGLLIEEEFQHTTFAFHPEARALKELYEEGELAVIHACGLLNGTRSHFDAMDLIERGINKNTSAYDGWIARYLDAISSDAFLPIVSASGHLAKSFQGYNKAASINNLLLSLIHI